MPNPRVQEGVFAGKKAPAGHRLAKESSFAGKKNPAGHRLAKESLYVHITTYTPYMSDISYHIFLYRPICLYILKYLIYLVRICQNITKFNKNTPSNFLGCHFWRKKNLLRTQQGKLVWMPIWVHMGTLWLLTS